MIFFEIDAKFCKSLIIKSKQSQTTFVGNHIRLIMLKLIAYKRSFHNICYAISRAFIIFRLSSYSIPSGDA